MFAGRSACRGAVAAPCRAQRRPNTVQAASVLSRPEDARSVGSPRSPAAPTDGSGGLDRHDATSTASTSQPWFTTTAGSHKRMLVPRLPRGGWSGGPQAFDMTGNILAQQRQLAFAKRLPLVQLGAPPGGGEPASPGVRPFRRRSRYLRTNRMPPAAPPAEGIAPAAATQAPQSGGGASQEELAGVVPASTATLEVAPGMHVTLHVSESSAGNATADAGWLATPSASPPPTSGAVGSDAHQAPAGSEVPGQAAKAPLGPVRPPLPSVSVLGTGKARRPAALPMPPPPAPTPLATPPALTLAVDESTLPAASAMGLPTSRKRIDARTAAMLDGTAAADGMAGKSRRSIGTRFTMAPSRGHQVDDIYSDADAASAASAGSALRAANARGAEASAAATLAAGASKQQALAGSLPMAASSAPVRRVLQVGIK